MTVFHIMTVSRDEFNCNLEEEKKNIAAAGEIINAFKLNLIECDIPSFCTEP